MEYSYYFIETYHCKYCLTLLFEKDKIVNELENIIVINDKSTINIHRDNGLLKCDRCLAIIGDDLDIFFGIEFYNIYPHQLRKLVLSAEFPDGTLIFE